jgi:hydroxyacylglutathione hydrolase
VFVSAGEIPARLQELPRDGTPVAFVCGSGFRSSVASSVAARAGLPVVNVIGGMSAWEEAGLPVVAGT